MEPLWFLFLDDLQWVDLASLDLLKALITDPDIRYLSIIGAYRDNDVNSTHPLTLMLDELETSRVIVNNITLSPLDVTEVDQLIADSLDGVLMDCSQLAKLVYQKTEGNPSFVRQFLESLYAKRLLVIGQDSIWQWDIEKMKDIPITNNVVELVIDKISRLSPNTGEILKVAACIGDRFDMETLTISCGKPRNKILSDISEAIDEGLVLISDNGYKFHHDRIRDAVCSLITDVEKRKIHLCIGKTILKKTKKEQLLVKIFDVVNQLNKGNMLIIDQQEKHELAKLNLIAGRKAKASGAYDPAIQYLTVAMSLLSNNSWRDLYGLTFDIYIERSECEYLNGNFDEAEKLFDVTLKNSDSPLEKAKVYNLKIVLYTNMGRNHEAVELGLEGLKLFGVNLRSRPGKIQVILEFMKVIFKLRNKKIEKLVDLQKINDPYKLTVMSLLGNLFPPTYFTDMHLFAVAVIKMVHMSLQHGNAPVSASAYSHFGLILGSGFGRYKMGYEFGKIGLRLSEKFGDINFVGLCNFAFGSFINSWRSHARKNCDYLRKSFQYFQNSGNPIYAGYSLACLMYSKDMVGDSLDKLSQESQEYISFVSKIKENDIVSFFVVTQRNILSLKGLTKEPTSFSDDNFDEDCLVKEMKDNSNLNPLSWYYLSKLKLFYMYGNYTASLEMAFALEKVIKVSFGMGFVPDYCFYYSLTLTALYKTATIQEKSIYRKILFKNQRKMKTWAKNCPENYMHKYLLVAAEMSSTFGNEIETMQLYNHAIVSAKKYGYTQNEALGNELAAKYSLAIGMDNNAKTYLMEARSCYFNWGATAKVKDLERKYPLFNLVPQYTINDPRSPALDFKAVLKVSKTISDEIRLDKLLLKLMKVTMENAGAQRGFLIMEKEGDFFIEVECDIDKDDVTVLKSIPVESSTNLSKSVIDYVRRSCKDIVLNDAVNEDMFATDPYILKHAPKSLLCVPIINQGRLGGILYLENNLAVNTFTPQRLETLKLLSSQLAVFLENSKLYYEMNDLNYKLRREVKERANAEKALFEQARLASLGADIGIATTKYETLKDILCSCSELLVHHLDAAFVRIWTLNKHKGELELQASAGMYIHTDGVHSRIPVSKFKMGLIAQQRRPHLTNAVIGDSCIHDQKWAKREGMVAFAGYPLIVEDQLIGVVAAFARRPLTEATLQAMSSVADTIAICIKHKHAEVEIIEREKELRLITESSLDTIFIVSKTGTVLYVSPSMKELVGYEASEIIGTSFTKYAPKMELPRYWKALADVFFNKKVRNFETYVKHLDGHLVPVEITGHVVRREGKLVGQGTIRNITRRRKAEEEQKRLITAMESAGEAIAITDTDGYIQYVNPAFERTSGYKRSEAIRQNMRIFKSGKQNKAFYDNMWKTITKGNVWTGRVINKKKDGKFFIEMLTISPVHDSTGKVINFVSVKRDVTREVELEAQLRQSQRFESLGTMARGIAHDFNNILSSIIGFTEITKGDLSGDSEARDNLDEVLNASYRAKGLVRQILTSSQQSIEDREVVDIVPIVKEALAMVRVTLPNSIEICSDICKGHYTIMGAPDQIYQVIVNLCVNAGQAIGGKCGLLNVDLVLKDVGRGFATNMGVQKGTYVKLEVTDTGCGMSSEIMERIFDPFFTTKPVGEGSGMGLAVVHGIVASHKGIITVDSEIGKGSTFNVYFPLIEGMPKLDTKKDASLTPIGNERILFVDDEESIVRYSQKGLERLGYEITVSTDSEMALEMFSMQPDKFDILISDQTMPKMSGDVLARKVLSIKPGIPIIICSGFNNILDKDEVRRIGISECVTKPISSRNLAVIVRRVMEKNSKPSC